MKHYLLMILVISNLLSLILYLKLRHRLRQFLAFLKMMKRNCPR